MFNKKKLTLLISVVSALGCSLVFAGGDYLLARPGGQAADQTNQSTSTRHHFFVQADVGYARVAWNQLTLQGAKSITGARDGGFAFGLVAGMSLNSFFGVEGGWLHLPSVRYSFDGGAHSVKSYLVYGAATLSVPYPGLSRVYGLVGLGYRKLNNTASIGDGNDTDLVYGLGVKYPLLSSVDLGAQFLHQAGSFSGTDKSRTPNADLFLLTASYGFSL